MNQDVSVYYDARTIDGLIYYINREYINCVVLYVGTKMRSVPPIYYGDY